MADAWRGREVLVTGAAGFIGSHLSEALIARGARVTGVDCFTDYYDPELKRRNIAGMLGSEAFRLIEADLVTLPLAPLVERTDVIFHLAGQVGVRSSWGDSFALYLERNLRVTQRMLETLKMLPRKLVFASSSSVYGDAERLPVDEDMPRRPVSPYGITKSACEDMLRVYGRYHGVDFTALRYFTVYGPRQRPDMAFQRLLMAAAAGRPFTIYGDGTQRRDMTYVADIVEASIAAGERPEAAGEVINVAGGRTTPLMDVVEHVASFARPGFVINYQPVEKGDARDTSALIDKARRLLGYEPRTPWPDGIARQWEEVLRRHGQ